MKRSEEKQPLAAPEGERERREEQLAQADQIDQLVGGRIRALRKARRWTLHDLSGLIGISYVYLSELERGEKPWKLEKLAKAAAIFALPPSLLQEPSIPLERLYALAEMLEKLSALPEAQFVALAQLIESMKP